MNVIIKNVETRRLKIGDIVDYLGDSFIVIKIFLTRTEEYALMNLEDGNYATGSYDSLADLEHSLDRYYYVYSCDDYELVLHKKKKC